jgi:plasmid maintenance system antidote protein VapI
MAARKMPVTPPTSTSRPARRTPQGAATWWVDAAPFRAHVAHLMAAAELTTGTLALLTGVQPRAIARLMAGRDNGRPVGKISPAMARQLLQVRNSDVRALRCRSVPADAVTLQLRRLLRAGWSESRLAAALGVDRRSLSALLDGSARGCTALVALRAAAAVRTLGSAGGDELREVNRDVA